MKQLPTLGDTPTANTMNTLEVMVFMALQSAGSDKELTAVFMQNPANYFAKSGLPILDWQDPHFNDWFKNEINGAAVFDHMHGGAPLLELQGIGCTVCKVASWTVAGLIVAVGAAGLAYLTAGSAVVVALASFAGVSAEAALAFIVSLGGTISGGVSAVAQAICGWTGAC